jgi:hypothetical protein
MQEKVERETSFSYDKDPATEIRRFEQLKVNGLIDPRYADRMIGQYRDLQSADLRPAVNAAKLAKARIMEQEMAGVKSRESEGGTAITKKESLFLINRDVELSNSIETMRRQTMADGSGQEGFQSKLKPWVQKQEARAPKPANPSMVPLMPQGPDAWARSLGIGQAGPGNRAANYQLRQRVDNGAVMPQKEYIKNYDQYIETGRLSDAMKLLIKRSGYGAMPSQFFFKQWDKMYPGVKMNPDAAETLKALDQQKISYAQPGAGGVPVAANPYMQTAANLNNLIRSAGVGALNVFMPPASAATLDSQGGGRYGGSPFADSGRWATGPAQPVNHPETGRGYTVPGARDANNRPLVLSQGAANSFAAMMRDSGGKVRAADVASAQRSAVKNRAVGGVSGSEHLGGNAMDIHGASINWIRKNGPKYGWYVNDYKGTHGGHVEFRGRN